MQKLICELCGSNDFTKTDEGLFVCDYCRTKYTPEQAKSMVVEGTVRLDRSGDAASLLALAATALSGSNMKEAFDYANRALEIEPGSPTAWYLKGTAVGWMSTIHGTRFREMHHAYSQALANATDSERPAIAQWCADRATEVAAFLTNASLTDMRQHAIRSGVWRAHVQLAEEALWFLGAAFQWCPRQALLEVYISIASDLVRGVSAGALTGREGVQVADPAHRQILHERIEWAGAQMRVFNPSYVTPQPKARRKPWF